MARKTIEPTTEIGRQLEKMRREREYTKDAWCEDLEIGRPTYDTWLTRPVNIDFINVRRIAVVMGVTIDTVFGWIGVDVPIIHVPSWFRRPINVDSSSLDFGAGHPGWEAA